MTRELAPGMTVGSVRLLEAVKHPARRGQFWRCLCQCGNETIKYAGHLRAGEVKTCGCVKGAKRTHGMSHSPEYKAWDNARDRCRNPGNRKYPLYGGRGIQFCERWISSFQNFITDLGKRPSNEHSLERADGDGNYEPVNCIWATAEEQNNNRSINRHIVVGGKQMTVAQAARLTGIPHGTILSRLDAGKSDAEAVQ